MHLSGNRATLIKRQVGIRSGRRRSSRCGAAPGWCGWNGPRRPTVETRKRETVGRRGTSRDPWSRNPRPGRRPAPRARKSGDRAPAPARLHALHLPLRRTNRCAGAMLRVGGGTPHPRSTTVRCSATYRRSCRSRRANSTLWSAISALCSTICWTGRVVDRWAVSSWVTSSWAIARRAAMVLRPGCEGLQT